MKRFVTYLYECEGEKKGKNVGFIRMKIKEKEAQMEVCIRNFLHGDDTGSIYAWIYEDELRSVCLGEVQISNGQSDGYLRFVTDNIMESGYQLEDIEGIGIQMKSGAYIVSCWRDIYETEMMRGAVTTIRQGNEVATEGEIFDESLEEEFALETEAVSLRQKDVCLSAAEEVISQEWSDYVKEQSGEVTTYEKIDLSQIRDLPSPNWHLSTNSFLLHGFWNYGYLVLKKEMEGDQETLSLGVPGVFEKPEAVMAILFGFPEFEEIAKEQEEKKLVEKQRVKKTMEGLPDPQMGAFGGWFVELKK